MVKDGYEPRYQQPHQNKPVSVVARYSSKSLNLIATPASNTAMSPAVMPGKLIVIRYPDGYDCSAYETDTNAEMVRTYNQ